MPERVQAPVFRLALIGDAGRDPGRIEALIDDDKPGLYASAWAGEHEIKLALRADELPLAQRMDDHRGSGTVRSPASDLGGPILLSASARWRTAASCAEVDVGPAQAAQFA